MSALSYNNTWKILTDMCPRSTVASIRASLFPETRTVVEKLEIFPSFLPLTTHQEDAHAILAKSLETTQTWPTPTHLVLANLVTLSHVNVALLVARSLRKTDFECLF